MVMPSHEAVNHLPCRGRMRVFIRLGGTGSILAELLRWLGAGDFLRAYPADFSDVPPGGYLLQARKVPPLQSDMAARNTRCQPRAKISALPRDWRVDAGSFVRIQWSYFGRRHG